MDKNDFLRRSQLAKRVRARVSNDSEGQEIADNLSNLNMDTLKKVKDWVTSNAGVSALKDLVKAKVVIKGNVKAAQESSSKAEGNSKYDSESYPYRPNPTVYRG